MLGWWSLDHEASGRRTAIDKEGLVSKIEYFFHGLGEVGFNF